LNQFNKETPQTNDNYGMTYDYGSLMHYGGTSASFNKKPTMVPFDVNYQQTLGSPFISFIELSMLNEHYKCKERCDPRTSVKCEMGGFPHPRDYEKCICPGGYGGARCTERPSGCGEKIQAFTKWVTLEDVVDNNRENEDFLTCNYWIESPVGTDIQVRLLDFTKGLSVDGCKYAGVEIKTNKD
uniref:CUB domain-containing protein n=1 Tax=Haemonchus placei TaxID=6290 RepID=A0A0N4WXT3_HAEPC